MLSYTKPEAEYCSETLLVIRGKTFLSFCFSLSYQQNHSWEATPSMPDFDLSPLSSCDFLNESVSCSHWMESWRCHHHTALTDTLDWRMMTASAHCVTVALVTSHRLWRRLRWREEEEEGFLQPASLKQTNKGPVPCSLQVSMEGEEQGCYGPWQPCWVSNSVVVLM